MGEFMCYQCNSVPVQEEYLRCPSCQTAHKELCTKLDARPIQKKEKIREELFEIKSMRGSVEFTDLVSRIDAAVLGIKLPDK